MAEIISIVLSAIGVMLLLYSLSSFIMNLSRQSTVGVDGDFDSSSTSKKGYTFSLKSLDKSLVALGVSLIVLLAGRTVLSVSSNVGELFYYGLFVNIMGIAAILGISLGRSVLRISQLTTAFSIISVSLIVFAVDSVFL